ncbi:Fimbrin-5, variant 3, partial [Lathyrus oleraceus]
KDIRLQVHLILFSRGLTQTTDISVTGIIKGDNADSQDAKNSYHYRDDVQRSPRAFMLSNDFNMKNDSLAQDKPLKQRLGLEGRLRYDRGNHQDHEQNDRINGDKPDSPFHERAAVMMMIQGLGSNDFC